MKTLILLATIAIAPSIRPDGATVYVSKYCPPCQVYKQTLYQLKSEGYRIQIIDVDSVPLGGYRPKAVPETCFFSGSRLKSKQVGIIGYHKLKLILRRRK